MKHPKDYRSMKDIVNAVEALRKKNRRIKCWTAGPTPLYNASKFLRNYN